MAEKTEAEFSDNDRIAYCECGFFWTVPTGMPWRDCENCDEAPIDLIASYKALAQQDQGWEARRFTDGTGLFGVYHPAGTWQVGCQTPDRAQAEAWAAALNEGRPIQQDQGTGVGEAVVRDLVSDEHGQLHGPLGEAIAEEAGNYSLEFVMPEQIAQGFVAWLNRQPPATPEPQQEVDVEGAGRFEQLAQRFDKLRELQSLLDLADSMQPATSPTEQGGEVAE